MAQVSSTGILVQYTTVYMYMSRLVKFPKPHIFYTIPEVSRTPYKFKPFLRTFNSFFFFNSNSHSNTYMGYGGVLALNVPRLDHTPLNLGPVQTYRILGFLKIYLLRPFLICSEPLILFQPIPQQT